MSDKNVNETSVMAESTEKTTMEAPQMASEKKEKKAARAGELQELRGQARKVYRMSDGTCQAVYYSTPVHEKNEETGAYEEADYTLKEEADGRHYVSKKKGYTARFSKEEDTDELYSLERGDYKVTVLAAPAAEEKAARDKKTGRKPKAEKKQEQGKKNKEKLTYEGMETGADYEYTAGPSGIKENIVIREKAEIYRYPFTLRCENVRVQKKEGSNRIAIVSKETGKEEFHIPAPFMKDAKGAVSTAVTYEVEEQKDGDVQLTVEAEAAWINDAARSFPVTIDPQIQISGDSNMTLYSWRGGVMSEFFQFGVGCLEDETEKGTYHPIRMYMDLQLPTLPNNPRIKKAELKLYQMAENGGVLSSGANLGLYQVLEEITEGQCTPQRNQNLLDYAAMRPNPPKKTEGTENTESAETTESTETTEEIVSYSFDITQLLDQAQEDPTWPTRLVLKAIDETEEKENYVNLYGNQYGEDLAPEILLTYETGYAVNDSYRTHTHDLGRFGQGSVDLQKGNLTIASEDFAWGGSRMPVTIRHLYNSALANYQYTENSAIQLKTADFSAMKLGHGWKLNLMQSMKATTHYYGTSNGPAYVLTGENGQETYYKKSEKTAKDESTGESYQLYEGIDGENGTYDPVTRILTRDDETWHFDQVGRLIRIAGTKYDNTRQYTYESGRLTRMTDGAGRTFTLTYDSSGYLTAITAPDETAITYTYSGELLSTITYPDGRKAVLTYASSRPQSVVLKDPAGADIYKVAYTFTGERLTSVAEYGVDATGLVAGPSSTYSYSAASGRTIVETAEGIDTDEDPYSENIIRTVYTFDDEGSVIGQYVYSEESGNDAAEGEESGIHPYAGDGGVGVVSNINNLLQNHGFETLEGWTPLESNCGNAVMESYQGTAALYGKKSWPSGPTKQNAGKTASAR